jgi:hypothetical protein
VTGIHPKLSEQEVTRLFEKYGEVEKCQIMRDPHTKESRGFGFVKMVTSDQADAAKDGLQGEVIEGRTLSIEKARRSRPRTPTPGKYFGPPKRGKCSLIPHPQHMSPSDKTQRAAVSRTDAVVEVATVEATAVAVTTPTATVAVAAAVAIVRIAATTVIAATVMTVATIVATIAATARSAATTVAIERTVAMIDATEVATTTAAAAAVAAAVAVTAVVAERSATAAAAMTVVAVAAAATSAAAAVVVVVATSAVVTEMPPVPVSPPHRVMAMPAPDPRAVTPTAVRPKLQRTTTTDASVGELALKASHVCSLPALPVGPFLLSLVSFSLSLWAHEHGGYQKSCDTLRSF